MASLEEPLRGVVGGKAATKLEQAFGLRTTGDMLRHYPRRYAQRGELTDLASLREGEHVTVFAQVAKVTARPMRLMPPIIARIARYQIQPPRAAIR